MPRSCATACYCVLPSYSDPVEIVWSKNLNFTLIVHISFIFKDCLIIRSSNLMLKATEYGSGTSVKEAGSVTIYTIYTLYTIYMVQVRSRRKSSERRQMAERLLWGAVWTRGCCKEQSEQAKEQSWTRQGDACCNLDSLTGGFLSVDDSVTWSQPLYFPSPSYLDGGGTDLKSEISYLELED